MSIRILNWLNIKDELKKKIQEKLKESNKIFNNNPSSTVAKILKFKSDLNLIPQLLS
jgi:hypothetical protein